MDTTQHLVAAPRPSLSGWQQRNLHTVTCPSGQRLRIRIPGIGTLLEHGDLPDDLVEQALLELTWEGGAAGALAIKASDPDTDSESLLAGVRKLAAFQRELVKHAVREVENGDEWVAVELDDESLWTLPEDDLAMVAEIVQRLRGTDARGVRIGVEPLDRWRRFQHHHGCSEDCESCEALVRELSSADVVSV